MTIPTLGQTDIVKCGGGKGADATLGGGGSGLADAGLRTAALTMPPVLGGRTPPTFWILDGGGRESSIVGAAIPDAGKAEPEDGGNVIADMV